MRPKLRGDSAGSWSIRNPPQDLGDLWASMQAGVPWARKITVTQKCKVLGSDPSPNCIHTLPAIPWGNFWEKENGA